VSGSLSVVSMYDIFANYLQRGNVDVGFMGGAQIDKYGNINATVIGGIRPSQGAPARLRRLAGDRRLGEPLLHHDPAPEAALPRKSGVHDLGRIHRRQGRPREELACAAEACWRS
jgi:hypothetical protein